MTNISPSDFKRVPTTFENRRRLPFRRVLPDNLEVPTTINSPVIDRPTLIVLNTPNAIRAAPSSMLISSHIQAGNSSAEIRYSIDGGESIDATLAFSFWFLNSGANPVSLTNIKSRLVINGLWEVSAACNPLVYNWNHVYFDSAAVLRIVEFWSQPPIFPPEEDGQFTDVAFFDIDGGLCETDPPGKNENEWILNKSYDVTYSSLEVPPKGNVLFEVRLSISTNIRGGGPNLALVNSSIVCPSVQFQAIEVIQGPPIFT